MAIAYERAGVFEEAINTINILLNRKNEVNDLTSKAKVALARNFFYMNKFNEAATVSKDIIISDCNDYDKFRAKMILHSIERTIAIRKGRVQ